jgi:hypothetical protein
MLHCADRTASISIERWYGAPLAVSSWTYEYVNSWVGAVTSE